MYSKVPAQSRSQAILCGVEEMPWQECLSVLVGILLIHTKWLGKHFGLALWITLFVLVYLAPYSTVAAYFYRKTEAVYKYSTVTKNGLTFIYLPRMLRVNFEDTVSRTNFGGNWSQGTRSKTDQDISCFLEEDCYLLGWNPKHLKRYVSSSIFT